MSITSIRRTILSVLRCTALYRRAPALAAPAAIQETLPKSTAEDVVVTSDEALVDVPAPTPTTPERIPVADDDTIPALDEVLGRAVVPAQDDPRTWLGASTIPAPRQVCQPPAAGSYQWWGTHAWQWTGSIFACDRCERVWPAPHGERGDE